MGNSLCGSAVEIPPRLANVPPFPSVAMKLLSLLSDENSNFASIAACIATDPALAGRLIKRANAADQASYCETSNVLQAVSVLGMERTRELSMAIATHSYAQSAIKAEILQPCWSHTMACALAASEVARHCGLRPTEAYTAGLLHDIGRLGLMTAYPAEYAAILTEVAGRPEDLARLERDRFGLTHLEAGGWLAHQWNLPESLVETITRHAETPTRPVSQMSVVQIAARLADLLGFCVIQSENLSSFEEITATMPEPARLRLKAHLPALREGILRELQLSNTSGDAAGPGAKDAEEAGSDMLLSTDETTEGSSRWLVLAALVVAVSGGLAFYLWR